MTRQWFGHSRAISTGKLFTRGIAFELGGSAVRREDRASATEKGFGSGPKTSALPH